MGAANNGTTSPTNLVYDQYDWGDLIRATKDQLQALGLGVGLAFPGETGGPRRKMTVRDPRGYRVEISSYSGDDGTYSARIAFPDWPERPSHDLWFPPVNGVKKCQSVWSDEYVGSAEALERAGLVEANQLPGMPGMRKVRVTIFPDGTIPTGPPTANSSEARKPGARVIERASRTSYRVRVRVSEEEGERRWTKYKAAEYAWQQQVRSLPRPAPLQPTMQITRPLAAPPMAPLFDAAPAQGPARKNYEQRVWDSVVDFVNFTQTSAY